MLEKIDHFLVLMLENRSFDHVLGGLRALDARIDGVSEGAYSNRLDPESPASPVFASRRATRFDLPFDPGHEFADIQTQIFGSPAAAAPAMSGFVKSARNSARSDADAGRVMEFFAPEQLPVISTLAREFAVFNHWHASLPGPTWPNRFFVHAATSGGLTASPDTASTIAGFSFPNGTIFDRIGASKAPDGRRRTWRIYHGGLPQTAGIGSLRGEFINPFTERFCDMDSFEEDLAQDAFPDYVFIEPRYDTGNQFRDGDSMHPLNDARKGEALVKRVYEALRSSRHWESSLLVVTFDEHGGFFDHVSPPPAVPPDEDRRYATPGVDFRFDRLGVRVPAILVSPYTARGTVIGAQPGPPYDHASILASVESRFGLAALTDRDRHAPTLEAALNLDHPRAGPDDAPLRLPEPGRDNFLVRMGTAIRQWIGEKRDPPELSAIETTHLALAHGCYLAALHADQQTDDGARASFAGIGSDPKRAAMYLEECDRHLRERRRRRRRP